MKNIRFDKIPLFLHHFLFHLEFIVKIMSKILFYIRMEFMLVIVYNLTTELYSDLLIISK